MVLCVCDNDDNDAFKSDFLIYNKAGGFKIESSYVFHSNKTCLNDEHIIISLHK
jgi:hypothetical protein